MKELRDVAQLARQSPTILFVDEIHHFNKAQQDALLPHVERGTIILIGATTENPSFEVIGPLLSRAKADVEEHGILPVPLHLRNAPTNLMKELGYGKEYKYPHDFKEHHVTERYLPDKLAGRRYYEPPDQGLEAKIAERLARLKKK